LKSYKNISNRVSETRLFKERKSLGIEFCWETATEAVFARPEDDSDFIGEYYLIESFSTGVVSVTDVKGIVLDKTDRILNLFRLGV
jgi:hypothetical protein